MVLSFSFGDIINLNQFSGSLSYSPMCIVVYRLPHATYNWGGIDPTIGLSINFNSFEFIDLNPTFTTY